jgi:Tol biopolymer transport system component
MRTAIFLLVTLVSSHMSAQTSATRLAPVVDSYPALSPDGRLIAFQSNRSGAQQLYVSKPDGTDLRLIRQLDFAAGSPSWSPDGTRVAFAGEPGGDSEIFVIDISGQNLRRLTAVAGDDSHPHWSPDGTRIMFNSSRATPDPAVAWNKQHHEIFSMKVDGTDLRQHTKCRTVCTYGSYAPDMTRIVYRKVIDTPGFQWDFASGTRNSEVFVANADGSGEVNLSNSASFDGWPMWSPDGQWIVFASNREGPANVGQVFAVTHDGKSLVRLTTGLSHVQPSWNADGTAVYAYQRVDSSQYEYGGIIKVDVRLSH